MRNQTTTNGFLKALVISLFTLLWLGSAQAYDCLLDTNDDGDADTNVDTDSGADSSGLSNRVACGNDATASATNTTAVGDAAQATGLNSTAFGHGAQGVATNATALGTGTIANKSASTAVGVGAQATGNSSTTLGGATGANGANATALGYSAYANSNGAVSVGAGASWNGGGGNTDSPRAIAIGFLSSISGTSPGAIAIGGDVDGDTVGAQASAPGAIAIGADVLADKAHTMSVGVPIEVRRDDGTTQVLVNESSAGNTVRTLFNLICNTCTPGFRINQLLPSNQVWNFRMLQSGAFSVDDPATIAKEAEFRSGGDLKIGGTLIQASSRSIKKNIVDVNPATVLEKIEALPIYHWTYAHNPDHVRHMGPMSEDFYKAFGLGDTDKGIAGVDSAGVALAAIKSLNQQSNQLKTDVHNALSKMEQALTIKDLKIAELINQNKALSERLRALEATFTEIDELKQQLASVLAMSSNTQLAHVVSE